MAVNSGLRLIPTVYRHTQSVASTQWDIQHNLGGSGSKGVPVVDAIINDGGVQTKVIPMEVLIVDANNLSIKFSAAHSGYAVIAG